MGRFFQIILILGISLSHLACGDNMLESLEETNNVNDAAIALDNGNTSKAISLCYDELGATYKSIVTRYSSGTETDAAVTQANLESQLDTLKSSGKIKNPYNIASILASAYAQKAGVDMIDVALNLASTDLQSENSITTLGTAINANPTQSVLDDMDLALIILRGIGSSNYRAAESYKDAIFQMAQVALFTSSLPDLDNLTEDDALSILSFLESALSSSITTSEDESSEAQASLDAINEAYTSIGISS